jgi:hypothetical protein
MAVRKAGTRFSSEVLAGASPREDLGDGDHPFLIVAPGDRPPVADAKAVQAHGADQAPTISLRQPTRAGEDALTASPAETR